MHQYSNDLNSFFLSYLSTCCTRVPHTLMPRRLAGHHQEGGQRYPMPGLWLQPSTGHHTSQLPPAHLPSGSRHCPQTNEGGSHRFSGNNLITCELYYENVYLCVCSAKDIRNIFYNFTEHFPDHIYTVLKERSAIVSLHYSTTIDYSI